MSRRADHAASARALALVGVALLPPGLTPTRALAQDEPIDPAPADAVADLVPVEDMAAAETGDVVVVEGQRIRGSLSGPYEPELVLGEDDIAGYGVSTIGELLDELLTELSSSRGRRAGPPVVLLNGRRISGFREIGRYPVEALARVEVYPEEASLSYGFAANQRVINFILKPKVTIRALEAGVEAPEEGGSTSVDGLAQRLFVDGDTRFSLDADGGFRPPILESERDVAFDGDAGDAALRSLVAEQDDWSAGFSAGRGIAWGATATLSGSFRRTNEDDFLGPEAARADEPLDQVRRTDDFNLGLSVTSKLAPTTWTLTGNFNIVDVETETEIDGAASAPDLRVTDSRRRTAELSALVTSKLAQLEAGAFAVTAQAGVVAERQQALIVDAAETVDGDATRETLEARLSADLPLMAPGPLPGEISLNGNIEVRDLTDFGTLITYGYGVTWRANDTFRIIASTTREEGAPSLGAVGEPTVVTPAARVFDFATGADAFVAVVDGGNPDLIADRRRVWKVGVQIDPTDPQAQNTLQFNIDYTRSRIDDEARIFPLLTEEFETAFPDRVTRDASGALLAFDRRPVIADETRRQELRTGVNWTRRLKRRAARAGAPPPQGKRRRSGRPGRLRASVYHRWALEDEVTIAEGLAPFDFLDGSATGGLGGVPRHSVDVSMYRWNDGVGVFAGGSYRTATEVDTPDGRLRFSDILRANVQVTYEFNYADRVLRVAPWLEETRLTFQVANLFDEKVQVTDETGETPLSFQEDVLDPFGRIWRFEIRRRF